MLYERQILKGSDDVRKVDSIGFWRCCMKDRFYRVLTMVYNTQDYRIFWLCPSSDIPPWKLHILHWMLFCTITELNFVKCPPREADCDFIKLTCAVYFHCQITSLSSLYNWLFHVASLLEAHDKQGHFVNCKYSTCNYLACLLTLSCFD
jgi:hypothetical protein